MNKVQIGDLTAKINDHVNAGYVSGHIREISKDGTKLLIEFTAGHTVPRYTDLVTHVNGIEVQREALS